MPRLWTETIEGHRRAVHDATLDAAASLVAERGLSGVTMSAVAARTGIGRATLYKHFPDVESILTAWHQRQVVHHLQVLERVRDASGADQKLAAVLAAYAELARSHPSSELSSLLHHGEHVLHAERQLAGLITDLISDAGRAGNVRTDVAPAELARYCLHALNAASTCSSRASVRRLVDVTVAGLRPPGAPDTLADPTAVTHRSRRAAP
jgi:AcrR family transcriptional regulator